MDQRDMFLTRMMDAAKNAGHVWPAYAACEAALESDWGLSRLTLAANNLFGRKQSAEHPVYETLDMPTREFLHGAWQVVVAHWVKYPHMEDCFTDRMAVLHRLLSLYGSALQAATGEEFVRLVSEHWSTDPHRADKVLTIYSAHRDVLEKGA